MSLFRRSKPVESALPETLEAPAAEPEKPQPRFICRDCGGSRFFELRRSVRFYAVKDIVKRATSGELHVTCFSGFYEANHAPEIVEYACRRCDARAATIDALVIDVLATSGEDVDGQQMAEEPDAA